MRAKDYYHFLCDIIDQMYRRHTFLFSKKKRRRNKTFIQRFDLRNHPSHIQINKMEYRTACDQYVYDRYEMNHFVLLCMCVHRICKISFIVQGWQMHAAFYYSFSASSNVP